jgi:hypothetical protein
LQENLFQTLFNVTKDKNRADLYRLSQAYFLVNFGGSFNFEIYTGPWEYDAKIGQFQNFKMELSGTYSHET